MRFSDTLRDQVAAILAVEFADPVITYADRALHLFVQKISGLKDNERGKR